MTKCRKFAIFEPPGGSAAQIQYQNACAKKFVYEVQYAWFTIFLHYLITWLHLMISIS